VDVEELLKENVIGGIWNQEEKCWCVVIPANIFTRIIHLIPRGPEDEE